MQRSIVLLPHPLGPNSVKNEPVAISSETSSSARRAVAREPSCAGSRSEIMPSHLRAETPRQPAEKTPTIAARMTMTIVT